MKRCVLSGFVAMMTLAAAGSLVACAEDDSSSDVQDVQATSAKFEVYVGEDDQHYFRLVANTGEKLLRSEGYTVKANAEKGVASVKRNGLDTANYEVRKADDGQYYFNVVAQNGEIVATSSALYPKKKQAVKAVSTAKLLLGKITDAEPKMKCGMKRLASTPQGEGETWVDVTNLGEEEYVNGDSLDAFESSHSFDVYYYDGQNLEIMFYENKHVQDEVGGMSCEKPATLVRGTTFCKEPITIDANLGTGDDEENTVHAYDFICRVE